MLMSLLTVTVPHPLLQRIYPLEKLQWSRLRKNCRLCAAFI